MKIIENNNNIPPVSVVRALSSSSVVTKEDIKNVEIMLSNAQIGQSEMDLRELEINKKMFAQEKSNAASNDKSNDVKSFINKRDRTESDRDLMKQEQKPSQNSRGKEESCIESSIFSAASSISSSNDNCDKDEIADGEDPDAPTTKRWTKNQDAALRESVRIHGEKNWKAIAELVPGRNHAQCLQRWRKVLKPGLVKGHWSFEEDQVLEFLVTQGCHNWGQIAERIPGRTPKQCRERWKNHLDPSINKGPYTEEEDAIILEAQERMGNKWSQISQLLKGRTEDSVKIRWKSLKQNPAKAAASHAQNKRQQQAATAAFQSNAALMRQRQMQLIEHQRQLQQNEVSQQLHHQQQLQQEQLQLRLQEKLLQDKQLQGHSGGVPPHSPVLAAHSMAPEVGNSLIVKHEVVEPIPHDVMYPHHTDYDHLGMYPTYHPSQPPFPQHQHQTYHPDPFQQQVPYNIDTPPFNNSAAFGYSPQVSFQNLHDANGASSNNSSPSNDADIHAQLPPLVGHTDALWDLNNLPKEEVDISSSRLWNDLKPDSSNPFDHDDVDPDAMFETIAKELGNDSLQFTQL
jgi:myb proto-oncogene protein